MFRLTALKRVFRLTVQNVCLDSRFKTYVQAQGSKRMFRLTVQKVCSCRLTLRNVCSDWRFELYRPKTLDRCFLKQPRHVRFVYATVVLPQTARLSKEVYLSQRGARGQVSFTCKLFQVVASPWNGRDVIIPWVAAWIGFLNFRSGGGVVWGGGRGGGDLLLLLLMMKWCLMSSDVSWHIRDKLRPMPKHGSI